MKIKQNIGIVNSLIRISAGLTILSWSTAKLARKPWRDSYMLMGFLGAMKVAEGIVRYCPVTDLIEKNMKEPDGGLFGKNDGELTDPFPYNPS